MGDNVGNERRGSDRWPARSAMTGLMAGALGIDRSDKKQIMALENGYRIGVAMRRIGDLLVDYHTAQHVPRSVTRRPNSRAEALAIARRRNKIGTILSEREYYERCLFDVVVTSSGDAPWSLEAVSDRLREPYFVPYFGRKACPLDRPMYPLVLKTDDAISALASYAHMYPSLKSDYAIDDSFVARFDTDMLDVHTKSDGRLIRRRDGVVDRQRWLFADREVVEVKLNAGGTH